MNKSASHNSATNTPKVYDSAVDWWIAILIMMTPVFAAIIGIYLVAINRPGDAFWLFITGAITLFVTALFAVPCRYTILDDTLSIRCGILLYRVPLVDIKTVEKSSSWISGPALSLKRVLIATEKRRHFISPKFRDDFIHDVRKAIKRAKVSQ